MYKKVFRSTYIEDLRRNLINNSSGALPYQKDEFNFDENQVLVSKKVNINYPELIMPESKQKHFDFENSRLIYESMINLSPVDATDYRFWTYLSHDIYWKYVKARSRVEEESKSSDSILSHWFITSASASNYLRHDISKLWWVAYLTFDESRSDKYELTEEAFSMLDYTRDLLPSVLGRNRNFTHGLLEYVIENKDLFQNNKQNKVRLLMRKMNFSAGYKLISILDKSQIKELLSKYSKQINEI